MGAGITGTSVFVVGVSPRLIASYSHQNEVTRESRMIVRWGRGRGLRGGRIASPSLDSVPTLVLEISPIAPERVANQSILETETGPREDGGGYLVLTDSPDSTLPRFRTIISPTVFSNNDDNQIVLSEPMVSSVTLSITYNTFLDYPLTSLWRKYNAIRLGDTPRTEREVHVVLALVQWEPYCYTCGEMGHYPRMYRFISHKGRRSDD
ncbi:unnamed protein product [Arabidopsis lyrata]|nr:unnamed protein product [Arabidopsis lyrata]